MRGFNGVTADEIAKEVGCSHGLLFHYFSNKEDLFQAVVNNLAVRLDEEIIKDVNFDQRPKFVMQDLIDAYLNALKSSKDDYACTIYLLVNLWIQSRSLSKKKQKEFEFKIFDRFYQIIEKGQAENEFIDYPVTELTITVTSILKGIAYNRIYLGYNKCIIPKSSLMMRMLLKNRKELSCYLKESN